MINTSKKKIPSKIPIQLRSLLDPAEGTAADGWGAPTPCNEKMSLHFTCIHCISKVDVEVDWVGATSFPGFPPTHSAEWK